MKRQQHYITKVRPLLLQHQFLYFRV